MKSQNKIKMWMVFLVASTLSSALWAEPILENITQTWSPYSVPSATNLPDYGVSEETRNLDWRTWFHDGALQEVQKSSDGTSNGAPIDRILIDRTGTWSLNDSEKKYFPPMNWTGGTYQNTASNVQAGPMIRDGNLGTFTFTVENIGGSADEPWSFILWGYTRNKTTPGTASIVDMTTQEVLKTIALADLGVTVFRENLTFAADPGVANPQKLVVHYDIGASTGNYSRWGVNAVALIIPEPTALVLLGLGGLLMLSRRRV